MPANQQAPVPGPQLANASKSTLVRSKSLRLPSAKPKLEIGSSTLTRHGSIRQAKSQTGSTLSKQQPLSVLRKPVIKPKPVFGSKSTENLSTNRTDSEAKRQFLACRSPTKNYDGAKGVTFLNESYMSDSPSSLPSERSLQSRDTSWTTPDLSGHVKRLTEEHEKLQIEYARQRMQMLELSASQPLSMLRRDLQHLSHSDSHLAAIPENSPGSATADAEINAQSQEVLRQIYKSEVVRLQDENRKLQRKYWEQVLNSDSIEDEVNGGASQQVVELIDKLDDKQKELVQALSRIQELENSLSGTALELHQCQDALQDYQCMLEEDKQQREKLEKQYKDATSTISELQENVEFLQEERSTLAEALQETEQSLSIVQADRKLIDTRLNELMTRARKLFGKVNDKNLQIQLLQAELDRTEGRARDMLLSQGAELTMTAMNLSELSINLHGILTTTSDFAANELELQKEMLDEIMADLDSESDKNDNSESSPVDEFPKPIKLTEVEKILPKDPLHHTTIPDVYKSLPDLPSTEMAFNSLPPVSTNGPVSLVQTIIWAAQGSRPTGDSAKTVERHLSCEDEKPCNSVSSSCENLVSTASESHVSKMNFGRTGGAFKPVGTAIPFRPVSQSNREISSAPVVDTLNTTDEEKRKASLEGQLTQMTSIIGKLTKVIDLTQSKYLLKMSALKDEILRLKDELSKVEETEKYLRLEVKVKSDNQMKLSESILDKSTELKNLKQCTEDKKVELLSEISRLKEENKCLDAVNKEQLRQLKDEIQTISDSAVKRQGNSHFATDALAICDKLSLKQEIVKLKEQITQKEQLLQSLAQKFTRTKKVLEENVQKADREVECLDIVIQRVLEGLQCCPDLVDTSPVLKSIFLLVSGHSPPEEYRPVFNKEVTEV